MKKSIFGVVALAGLASASAANAQSLPVLIIVDNTDPANVVFTATGNAAAVNDSSASIVGGVSLLDLFAGAGFDTEGSIEILGDLSPSGNIGTYNRVLNDIGTLGTTSLNFWESGGSGDQSFNTNDPAFTGSTLGFDFGGVSFNSSGLIVIGDTGGIPGSGATLGTWQLIPAPGTLAMALPFGIAAIRRRR
jgi:hypothetical protein